MYKPKSLWAALAFALTASFSAYVEPAQGAATYVLRVRDPSIDGLGSFVSGSALVRGTDGNYYGIGSGTDHDLILRMTPAGDVAVLHSFDMAQVIDDGGYLMFVNTDGTSPWGLVLASDGNFYGTTNEGGVTGSGTIFRISADGAFKVLHTFETEDTTCHCQPNNGGAFPSPGPLALGKDGALYGIASRGGANGSGTFFKIGTDGSFATLYSFPSSNSYPIGVILGSDGNFYGSLSSDIFKLTPNGSYSKLYSSDTDAPFTLIAGRDGNLYGTTYGGAAYGNGAIFKLTTTGSLTLLHSFAVTPNIWEWQGVLHGWATRPMYVNAEGSNILSLMQTADGGLYGINHFGPYGHGTMFKFAPDGTFTTVYAFNTFVDGETGIYPSMYPQYPVIPVDDGNGNLIGITIDGPSGQEAIYKMVPSAPLTVTASFSVPTVKLGRSTTLSWSAAHAASCTLAGDVTGLQGPVATSGTKRITLYSKQLRTNPAAFYAIVQCTGSDGAQANATATLTIN